jgi:hypothetical protein
MKGGKRAGAGRPDKNSVRKNITLPASYLEFVKENNYSLSRLTQQKIEELMLDKIKIGQKIKANWDKQLSQIVGFEEELVVYDCFAYKNTTSDKRDGYFRDTKETIIKEFTFVD